jgi:predicted ATPase
LLSVVYGFWVAKFVAFNGDIMRDFANYFRGLAKKQETTVPKMIGDRIIGTSLLLTGEIRKGRAHLDRTLAVYDPAEHRQLATRFGQDVRVSALCYRALGLWMLGYPEAALADTNRALNDAREIGQAATLMFMLSLASFTHIFYGDYTAANALADELISSANEKGALYWKAQGMSHHGCVSALTGEAAAAVQMIGSGTAAWRSTGATLWTPLWLSYLAKAYTMMSTPQDTGFNVLISRIAACSTSGGIAALPNIPIPPAEHTARARGAVAMNAIPALMKGTFSPYRSVIRVFNMESSSTQSDHPRTW